MVLWMGKWHQCERSCEMCRSHWERKGGAGATLSLVSVCLCGGRAAVQVEPCLRHPDEGHPGAHQAAIPGRGCTYPGKGAPPLDFAQRPSMGWQGRPLTALGPATTKGFAAASPKTFPQLRGPAPSCVGVLCGRLSGPVCLKSLDLYGRSIPPQGG